jgi:GNAT superfamily N-acetyltransferase
VIDASTQPPRMKRRALSFLNMSSGGPVLRIQKATREHLPRVVELMRGLAEFEKMLDEFQVTEELLDRHLFARDAVAELFVGCVDDEVRGYALCFYNFSSFQGRPGMYIEDIYVEPSARGQGLGKALMLHIVRLALERGCRRCDWVVLDWNEQARQFYQSLGARPLSEWTLYRMDGDAMNDLLKRPGEKT